MLLIQQANLIETFKKAKENEITQVYISQWVDSFLVGWASVNIDWMPWVLPEELGGDVRPTSQNP